MTKPIEFPSEGRSDDFYADYTMVESAESILVTDGWIYAPGRGSELMNKIISELQVMATTLHKPVIHRFEASTLRGRQLIQKFPEYLFVGRSSTRDPVYEKQYNPSVD